MERFYFVERCGSADHVIEACSGDACGLRSLDEGLHDVALESECSFESLGSYFVRPDILNVGGCGEIWTLRAQPDGWTVEEQEEDTLGVFTEL